MKSGKELTTEWFERVWNGRDERAVHDLLSESCEIMGLESDERGPDAFLGFYRTYQKAFDSIQFKILEMVEEDNLVFGTTLFTAVHKKSGNDVELIFAISARWENGQIVEARNVVDFTRLLSQIGTFDESLLAKALEV